MAEDFLGGATSHLTRSALWSRALLATLTSSFLRRQADLECKQQRSSPTSHSAKMRIKRPSRKLLTAALLLASPIAVSARSPAVSVGLKASWNAAPYLLELL